MKYRFIIYLLGVPLTSKPLTREELEETIKVNLDNGCDCFSVEPVED